MTHRADHLALVPGPVDVAEVRGLAGAGVAQGRGAVGLLAALLHVEVGLRVLHGGLRADLDAADGVDHVDEAAEADLDVVVDADPGRELEGLHEQLGPAVGERGVDLGDAVARHLQQAVARDRHQQVGARPGVQQHDRVGAPALALAGAELQLLLAAEALTAVAADQEVGGAVLLCGTVAARVGADLVDLRPGPQRHRDQEDQPDQHERLDPAEAEPAARLRRRPAAAGRWRCHDAVPCRRRNRRRAARRGPRRGRRTSASPAGSSWAASGWARGRDPRTEDLRRPPTTRPPCGRSRRATGSRARRRARARCPGGPSEVQPWDKTLPCRA